MAGHKHLEHFEDLAVLDPQNFYSIINNISSITLKWDGIGIVGGYEDHKPFIAGKGFLNKVPKKYFCIHDIETDDIPAGMKSKLCTLARYFDYRHETDHHSSINQGDLLWFNGNYEDTSSHRIFHSNIIQYKIPLDIIHDDHKIALAWHTPIQGRLFDKHFRIANYHLEINANLPDPAKWGYDLSGIIDLPCSKLLIKKYIADMYKRGRSTLSIHGFSQFLYKLYETEKLKFKTLVKQDSLLRQYEDAIGFAASTDILARLEDVCHYKMFWLEELNAVAHNTFQTTIIENGIEKPCGHEGFVVNSPFGSLKLVDRYQFSQYNQNPDVKRGWELNPK